MLEYWSVGKATPITPLLQHSIIDMVVNVVKQITFNDSGSQSFCVGNRAFFNVSIKYADNIGNGVMEEWSIGFSYIPSNRFVSGLNKSYIQPLRRAEFSPWQPLAVKAG